MLNRVPEFTSPEELKAHYARLRREAMAPRRIEPKINRPNVIDVSGRRFNADEGRWPPALPPAPPAPAPRDVLRLATRDIIMTQGPKSRARMIRKQVAEEHGLRLAEIDGPRRSKLIVAARHEAMARVYVECPELSTPEIGRMFGNRDHSTVLNAVRRMGVHGTRDHIERRG